MDITIITGLSGSGKSTALEALEDAGYYCVDNLPVSLLPKFLELPLGKAADISGLVFAMDLREKDFIASCGAVFDELRAVGYRFAILFLEADEITLINRYKQTRRKHPVSDAGSLADSIRIEKKIMADLRKTADVVVNTTHYTVHELKAAILELTRSGSSRPRLHLHVYSFGFKYGVPGDADLIMDVRFLANPYFVDALRPLSGLDAPVAEYVLTNGETRVFLQKYLDFLDYLIPLYQKEGKSYLNIAIGCTGGRHRSVVIVREVARHLKESIASIESSHRDIDR
jgi:UPF0042 nucleotide-binding protein